MRSLSSMNSEMYSGARLDRLMKCSNAVFSAFWNDFSLLNDAAINLPRCGWGHLTAPIYSRGLYMGIYAQQQR